MSSLKVSKSINLISWPEFQQNTKNTWSEALYEFTHSNVTPKTMIQE